MRTNRELPDDVLSDRLRAAIVASGIAYQRLERETGVDRSSIQRFVDGRQSLRLEGAGRIAALLGLELVKQKKRKG